MIVAFGKVTTCFIISHFDVLINSISIFVYGLPIQQYHETMMRQSLKIYSFEMSSSVTQTIRDMKEKIHIEPSDVKHVSNRFEFVSF